MAKKRCILAILFFFIAIQGRSQGLYSLNSGIHFKGGVSYDTLVSSNIGDSCNATGLYSFAGGHRSIAGGSSSFAFGYKAHATGNASFALGSFVQASQDSCIVIGSGHNSSNPLISSVSGISFGMGSAVPTMHLSTATGLRKTGKVAIGNVIPEAKLHILSDKGEDAGLILEPTDPTENSAFIRLIDGNHHISVNSNGVMEISSGILNRVGITSSNFKVTDNLIDLGVIGDRNITLSTVNAPSISSNAYPSSNGNYSRNAIGPSYTLEFQNTRLLLRTAVYMDPRYDLITNWRDAFSIKTDGDINLYGRVGIGNVTPQAKLHILSEVNEDAGLIIASGSPTTNSSFIQLRDTVHNIAVDRKGELNITAGNNLMGVGSSNFKISENLMDLGLSNDRKLVLSTEGTPSISSNAYPSDGSYSRNAIGPSYTLEFGNSGLLLRTATYMEPRNDLITNWRSAVSVKTDGIITLNGQVGINIENQTQDYALAVDGGVITTKVHIQDVNDWPDYVFGDDYRPMPLNEVGSFVAANGHLPGIPSEAEVKSNGYDVTEMQVALLGKIEELTLYMLRQQHEIDSLRTLMTVHFGYDACGNRVSRTLEFSRMGDPMDVPVDGLHRDATIWQASVRDVFAGGEALLFPNPTEGGFILSLTGGEIPDGTTATLCTLDGKVLEKRAINSSTEEFDLSGKPVGVYLLCVTSERETKVWKVVKRN